jgi:predicted PurR-regulated permease PerM
MRVEHDVSLITFLKILGLALGVALVIRGWPAMLLILIALMFVATLHPIHVRLSSYMGRGSALVLLIGGILLPIGLFAALTVPPLLRQLTNLVQRVPASIAALYDAGLGWGLPLGDAEIARGWTEKLPEYLPPILEAIAGVLGGVLGILTAVVLAVYLLAEGPHVGPAVIKLLPRRHRIAARQMLIGIAENVGNYVRGQLVLSTLAGLASFVMLVMLGVPEPLALSFLVAVTDAIPIVGAFMGAVPAVLVATSQGGVVALAVAVGYLLYQQVENHVLMPRVFSRTLNLPSSIILIAVLVGVTLMGFAGGLLALPVAAALPALIRFIGETWDREGEARARAAEETGSPL